ncbi:MAG: hypothetical protein U9O56_05325 [Campylobacterota bacterium]|nr:hypothetical protein [Campylobacterota bacterium]
MNTIEMKELIVLIKSTYKEHDDLEELLTDLGNNDYLDHWAQKMCDKSDLNNPELGKELFILAEKKCEAYNDFGELGEAIFNSLNDESWAMRLLEKSIELTDDSSEKLAIADILVNIDKEKSKDLYKEVEDNIQELSTYNRFINSIASSLEDKEWAKKIALNAVSNLKDSDDMFEFAGYSSEIVSLAKFIAEEDGLNDNESAKEIFDKIKSYEGVTDLLDAARAVQEIYEESDYTTQYIDDILEKAIEFVEEGYYCDIYHFIKDEADDEDKAEEYKDTYWDEMSNDHDQYESCEELFGENEDDSVDIDDIDFDDLYDKRNIVAFSTNNFVFSKIEDMLADNDSISDEAVELANESLSEFIDAVKEKFENHVEDTVYVQIDEKLREYKNDLDNNIEDFEAIILYMVLTKEVPAEIVNALFLDMDEYGFYATFENNDEIIIQGYNYGEYDTGYFSNDQDDFYINNFNYTWKCYPEAQKLLE